MTHTSTYQQSLIADIEQSMYTEFFGQYVEKQHGPHFAIRPDDFLANTVTLINAMVRMLVTDTCSVVALPFNVIQQTVSDSYIVEATQEYLENGFTYIDTDIHVLQRRHRPNP